MPKIYIMVNAILMPMKKVILLFSLVTAIVASVLVYKLQPQDNNHPIHYHAGFVVFVDGVRQDYTDFKYMNFIPCSEHTNKKTPEEEQIEKAHLHDSIGDVVHVHREEAYWKDLFKNIKVTFPDNAPIVAYRDETKIENILNEPITPDDSIVIIVGDETKVKTYDYVTRDHIKDVESQSELCGASD